LRRGGAVRARLHHLTAIPRHRGGPLGGPWMGRRGGAPTHPSPPHRPPRGRARRHHTRLRSSGWTRAPRAPRRPSSPWSPPGPRVLPPRGANGAGSPVVVVVVVVHRGIQATPPGGP
jgi:hypothetical protein